MGSIYLFLFRKNPEILNFGQPLSIEYVCILLFSEEANRVKEVAGTEDDRASIFI